MGTLLHHKWSQGGKSCEDGSGLMRHRGKELSLEYHEMFSELCQRLWNSVSYVQSWNSERVNCGCPIVKPLVDAIIEKYLL